MKLEHKKAIRELRELGYAVVIFGPKECEPVSANVLEEHLVQEGNYFLEIEAEAQANL